MNAPPTFARYHETTVQVRLCPECGHTSDGFLGICHACMDKRAAKHRAELMREEKEKRAAIWKQLCPRRYLETNWNHPGLSPVCCEYAHAWWAQPDGTGLGLFGPSGNGKTRTMWEILRRHHFAGRKVFATSSQQLQAAVGDVHADTHAERQKARKLIHDCKMVGILLIDDIGKEKMSAAVASTLHDIVETRFSQKRPILWTSEMTGEELAQKLGDNYANGLTRRIREASLIVRV